MAGEKGDKTPRRKREAKNARGEQGPGDQPPAAEGPSEQPAQEQQSAEPQTPREEPEPAEIHDRAPCPVVGVGASAGGLEALQGLFASLPSNPNLAFVVVQHRATDRTSVMKSLIEKHTKLTVKDIQDGMKIEPDTIYLAPADKDVAVLHGVLFVVEPLPHSGAHLPIDSFLRTLALDEAERAVCIILSGTGSDGTLGLREIKAAGGMAMVQKEDQAKYDCHAAQRHRDRHGRFHPARRKNGRATGAVRPPSLPRTARNPGTGGKVRGAAGEDLRA